MLRSLIRTPLRTIMVVIYLFVCVYVVAYPFTVVHYPPLTDLPFHAAITSIFRHYGDESYHFQEQFSFHILASPYWTHYFLGALLALFMPIVSAVKLATILLLLLVPAGLSVMFYGMKKSPLLGLLGLPLVWNTLTHWGFINFMAAIGLFAMVVGTTLLVLDRPTKLRKIGLSSALLAVFATHIFRFPFALAAVGVTALVMSPTRRRWRTLIAPILPSITLMLIWLQVRPKELSTEDLGPLELHFDRFSQVKDLLFKAFTGRQEQDLATQSYHLVMIGIFGCILFWILQEPWRSWSKRSLRWSLGVTVLPLVLSAGFLTMYLVLPMQIGGWWYVYPREIVSTLLIALGAAPNLPRGFLLRLPLLAAIAYGPFQQAELVAKNFTEFDDATHDFKKIIKHLPMAPKLGYLVFDRTHPRFVLPVMIHLPAWIQAEKGGWLSFHFISWNQAPVQYRQNSPDVPPPTPLRFEWTPDRFDVKTRGKFFDWFLVRRPFLLDPQFHKEPGLRLVDKVGSYWLYQRVGNRNRDE